MTAAPGGQLGRQSRKRGRRMSGMTWMFLGLLIFFIAAGVFTAVVKQIPRNLRGGRGIVTQSAPRSYAGVTPFDTTDGGRHF